jgi:hypothetical protein
MSWFRFFKEMPLYIVLQLHSVHASPQCLTANSPVTPLVFSSVSGVYTTLGMRRGHATDLS